MQTRSMAGALLVVAAALAAGPRGDGGVGGARGADLAQPVPRDAAIVYGADEARADLQRVCTLLDEGFVSPAAMDALLAERRQQFSRNVLHHVRGRAAFLGELGASRAAHCDAIGDAEGRELCRAADPRALLAQALESLALAIEGRSWAATPFGARDLRRWQRAGEKPRPGELMKRRCTATLMI